MIESTILIPILEKLERIEDIISGQAKEREALMTVKDVSAYAKCCEVTIRRALAKGTIIDPCEDEYCNDCCCSLITCQYTII